MDWAEMTADEFEALPQAKKPQPPSEWDPIMASLEAGRPVRIPVVDEADTKKKRLSVGRRAAMRGFEVEIRYGDGVMAVRRGADREKLRAGRLPKLVAEKAHELVDVARERLGPDDEPQDHAVPEITEVSSDVAPRDDGLTVDPLLTEGPFGDAPMTSSEAAAPRPPARRRKAVAS